MPVREGASTQTPPGPLCSGSPLLRATLLSRSLHTGVKAAVACGSMGSLLFSFESSPCGTMAPFRTVHEDDRNATARLQ